MPRKRNAKETLKEYQNKMGNELGEYFFLLTNECSWLHLLWNQYSTLFLDKNNHKLLNKMPFFFSMLHDILLRYIILSIARLTDPIMSCGKENLTLKKLLSLIDKKIKKTSSELLKSLENDCKFARDERHRNIAHKDLKETLKKLKNATKNSHTIHKYSKALLSIAKFLNTIEYHYCKKTTLYHITPVKKGVATLIANLNIALKVQNKNAEWRQQNKL